MFERFTDRARRVVVLAQEESRLLNHNYIGTEHILLGLVHEGEGVGAKALEELGISLNRARERVLEIIGHGGSAPSGHIPFTPRAKKVLELSLREALQLGHNYIGTEHILLGLIREGEGVGAQVLTKMGADLSTVRTKVIQLLSGYSGGAPGPAPAVSFTSSAPPRASVVLSGGTHGVGCSFCGRDFWDVDRYVTARGIAICSDCVTTAARVIAEAPASAERALTLPPRVFGERPADPSAVNAIEAALRIVFGGDPRGSVADILEDGERLASLRSEVRERYPQVVETSVSLERVRFTSDEEAEIRFTIALGGVGGPSVDGRAILIEGGWRVARETFCQVMQLAGIPCPPPDEPDA